MGKRGRPQKPLSELKLTGNYERTRQGDRLSDNTFDGTPEVAAWLEKEAAVLWERTINLLIRKGLATDADEPALRSMAQWWARYRYADTLLGEAIVSNDMDAVVRMSKLADMYCKRFESFLCRFGMTPADRARIKVMPKEDNQDTEKRYFA